MTPDDTAKRLTTIPGMGAMTAAAITAVAQPLESFSDNQHLAAFVGRTSRQHSNGSRGRLGRIPEMGRRDIRRLLIVGAVALV